MPRFDNGVRAFVPRKHSLAVVLSVVRGDKKALAVACMHVYVPLAPRHPHTSTQPIERKGGKSRVFCSKKYTLSLPTMTIVVA